MRDLFEREKPNIAPEIKGERRLERTIEAVCADLEAGKVPDKEAKTIIRIYRYLVSCRERLKGKVKHRTITDRMKRLEGVAAALWSGNMPVNRGENLFSAQTVTLNILINQAQPSRKPSLSDADMADVNRLLAKFE